MPPPIRRSPASRDEGGLSAKWHLLSLLAFILAMLSKGSVAMLPFVLLGLIAWHRRLRLKDLALMLPFFLVSGALVLTDIWFQKHGTGEIFRRADAWERLLGAGAVIWFYLGKALWPANLMFVYPEWHIRAGSLLWWVPLLAAAGVTIVLWRNRHRWSRPMLFAWGYFCVALVPVMGFTDVYFMKYSLVADRYAPLALIGVVVLATYYLPSAASSFPKIAAAGLICLLSVLTWRQCHVYRDARTLFLETVRRNPNCWMAYNYLGATLPAADLRESIADFKRAVEIKPDYAEARDNLGLALIEAGRLSEAGAQFEEEMRLEPDNPRARANLDRVRGLQDAF